MSDKLHVLYMPSTPLNLLVSSALASARKHEENASLYLIDQRQLIDQNHYYACLTRWADSPFQDIQYFTGRETCTAKLTERKNNFRRLKQYINFIQPDVVAVGSDRRIEFQYVMQLIKSSGRSVEGWYLDDGLYSYMGRAYHPIKDGINSLVKKITYGFWWDEPKTVGASKWINKTWLFKPKNAVELLQQKHSIQLDTEWFKSADIKNLSCCILSAFSLNGSLLATVDYVLIITHPNNQKKLLNYRQKMLSLVQRLRSKNMKIAIKYHPRQEGIDDLGLLIDDDVHLIPSGVAFEFVLPLLKSNAFVVGEMSSTLVFIEMLRNDIVVIDISKENLIE